MRKIVPALFRIAVLSKLQYVHALMPFGVTESDAPERIFIVPAKLGALAPQLVLEVVAKVALPFVTTVLAPDKLTAPVPAEVITPSVQYKLSALIAVPVIAIKEPPLKRAPFRVTVAPVSVENLAPVPYKE